MTTDMHDITHENVDAWALGALDADETRALETHIASCDACAAIADASRDTAGALGMAVPLFAAPVELRARVMASANALREMPSPVAVPIRSRSWWPQSAAAAVVIVGVGMMAWGAVMQRRVGDLSSRNDELVMAATSQTNFASTVHAEVSMASAKSASLAVQQDAMFDVVSQPDVQRVQLVGTVTTPAATGRYVWSSATKTGVLIARDLPPLDKGKKYCLWLVYDNAWVSGGQFGIDDGGTGRLVVRDIEDAPGTGAFRGFAVTVEAASATAPTKHTGPALMQANLN